MKLDIMKLGNVTIVTLGDLKEIVSGTNSLPGAKDPNRLCGCPKCAINRKIASEKDSLSTSDIMELEDIKACIDGSEDAVKNLNSVPVGVMKRTIEHLTANGCPKMAEGFQAVLDAGVKIRGLMSAMDDERDANDLAITAPEATQKSI